MADFDPNSYRAKLRAGGAQPTGFDPVAYRAKLNASAAPPTEEPGYGEAAGRAAVQGATANFGDEMNAAVQATQNGATPWYLRSPIAALANLTSDVPQAQQDAAAQVDRDKAAIDAQGPGGRLQALLRDYRLNRDADRAANERAKTAHRGVYLASEIASGIPLAMAMPGGQAKGLGALAKAGAAAGGLGGLGGSSADLTQGDVGGAAWDTGVGATLGAGIGAGAGLLGKLVTRAGAGIRSALADAAEMASSKAQKVFRTARSALGGETAAAFQAIAKAEEIAANAAQRYTPQQVAEAAAWLASPEVKAIAQNAADNLLAAGPERIAGSMQTARNVFEQAKKGLDPAAVEQAADELVSNPIKNQVLPRLKNYASRAIPPAVGGAVGGVPGAAVGFGAGAVMGNPGTALANMLKHPATRKMGWELLQRLGRAGAAPITTATERATLNAALQESPDVP